MLQIVALCIAAGAVLVHPQCVLRELVFDLSYPFDNATAHWPTAAGFEFVNQTAGLNGAANWYASNDFCVGEHTGTHLDAPYHFNREGLKVGDLPLSKLLNDGYVLDVEEIDGMEVQKNTTLEKRHVLQFEARVFGDGGHLPPNAIVLIRFNWGRHYGTPEYYNSATDAAGRLTLDFPGLSVDAARLLVARGIAGVGVDVASVDAGTSTTFDVHRVLSAANIFNLENVHIPSELVRYNGRLFIYALPMKIRDGSGAPCRILAFVSPQPTS